MNATMIQGTSPHDIFQLQVDKIHALPFLWGVEWLFIYTPPFSSTQFTVS